MFCERNFTCRPYLLIMVSEIKRHEWTYPQSLQIWSTSTLCPRTFCGHSWNTIRIRTTSATLQPCPHRIRINFQIEIHVRTASAEINPHPLRIRADTVRCGADCPRTQIRGQIRKCPPPRSSLVDGRGVSAIIRWVHDRPPHCRCRLCGHSVGRRERSVGHHRLQHWRTEGLGQDTLQSGSWARIHNGVIDCWQII